MTPDEYLKRVMGERVDAIQAAPPPTAEERAEFWASFRTAAVDRVHLAGAVRVQITLRDGGE